MLLLAAKLLKADTLEESYSLYVLRTFETYTKQVKRIEDGDDDVRVGRTATYVVVVSLIRF